MTAVQVTMIGHQDKRKINTRKNENKFSFFFNIISIDIFISLRNTQGKTYQKERKTLQLVVICIEKKFSKWFVRNYFFFWNSKKKFIFFSYFLFQFWKAREFPASFSTFFDRYEKRKLNRKTDLFRSHGK